MVHRTKLFGLVFSLIAASVMLALLVWMFDIGVAAGVTCDVPSDTYTSIQSAIDDGACDTINLTADLYVENVDVSRSVTIQGRGAESTTVEGSGFGGVFVIQAGHTVTLNNLAISNGWANNGAGIWNGGSNTVINGCVITNNSANQNGGGIYNTAGGMITLNNCTLSFNDSDYHGAGIYNHDGTLAISDSEIITNTARRDGGAIYNAGGSVTVKNSLLSGNIVWDYGGGIYHASGTMTIIGSAFTNNSADGYGGGLYIAEGTVGISATLVDENDAFIGGGIYNASGDVGIVNGVFISNSAYIGAGLANGVSGNLYSASTTIHGNTATSNGGGIANIGIVNIVNSTVSGNSARYGAGIENRESNNSNDFGVLTITNSTLNGNMAVTGGGIHNWDAARVSIANTIIANSSGDDCTGGGAYFSAGHNLGSDATCNFTADGDLPSTNPMLGPLKDNGGETWTHALLRGSPAIDAGDDAACPATDQRGEPRPRDGDGDGAATCDIGAYEAGETIIRGLTATSSSPTLLGQGTTLTATVTAGSNVAYSWDFGDGTSGNGVTVTHTYTAPREYTAVVTASNAVSLVTATTSVVVEDAIARLAAVNDSPTSIGQATTFSATVTAGSNVHFYWGFGDTYTATGPIVMHTYAAVNEYVVTVMAINLVSSEMKTIPVYITPVEIYLPLVLRP